MYKTFFKIKKLNENAKIPAPSDGNVGYDISSIEDILIQPGQIAKIKTGLSFVDNIGCGGTSVKNNEHYSDFPLVPFFKIEGRSGLASKGLFPVGGIIDPSYRGEICVLLYNSCQSVYQISIGDRIAQLVCYHTISPHIGSSIEFLETDEISFTQRGEKGFGSSGKWSTKYVSINRFL